MDRFTKVIALFIIVLCFVQCKKDDEPTTVNYGAEYFECKVNGEFFEATSTFTCTGLDFSYYPQAFLSVPEGYAIIGGNNCTTSEVVTIRINGLVDSIGLLDFNDPLFADSIFPYYRYFSVQDSDFVVSEKLLCGEMFIEHFIPRESNSTPYGSIKGTFNFTVTDTLYLDTFRITEGRFRFDVQQIF